MKRKSSLPVLTATAKCMLAANRHELEPLSRNCPGLKNFDWKTYIRRSEVRVNRVIDTLDYYYPGKTRVHREYPKILDFGSWLGNFSLALNVYGYRVSATEMWARYAPALDRQKHILSDTQIDCIDMSMITGRPQGPRWQVVLLMSVIEHIPDSPRRLLKIINDMLVPGGLLILDTPNLAYLYHRRALNRGRSPYVPIAEQWITESPFEGHVREYTAAEVRWMLEQSGFEILETDFFNYSLEEIPVIDHLRLALPPFYESPLLDRLRMWLKPELRELIFMVARKK